MYYAQSNGLNKKNGICKPDQAFISASHSNKDTQKHTPHPLTSAQQLRGRLF